MHTDTDRQLIDSVTGIINNKITDFAGDAVWTTFPEAEWRRYLSEQVNKVQMLYTTSDDTHNKITTESLQMKLLLRTIFVFGVSVSASSSS